jgi:hypothetical protein
MVSQVRNNNQGFRILKNTLIRLDQSFQYLFCFLKVIAVTDAKDDIGAASILGRKVRKL